jgi:Tfp pilus assembly protein PilF
LLRLAEISQRLGRTELAEKHFKQALAKQIPDTFLLAAYADFLLDQKRPAEVVALLKDKQASDTLLLRLVLAERMLNLPTAAARAETLAARFVAAKMRGDNVHEQEEARFALEVHNNPKEALQYAQKNWMVQREPRDARIFLEAALAARAVRSAQPVLQWLQASGNEDIYLRSLAQRLQGAAR